MGVFVYAAKHSPIYLLIMVVISLYLLILIGYLLLKKRNKFPLYLWELSAVFVF
ncbi:DUF4306 domain-containing protein [Oceanobacillus oncorhynchi subsp. oncorhynchi]|uniref:DUF4306 domain-containing protein n=1 Tax=Oceanobacillus oncorhynchi TaxID=545501 RepID=UPI00362B8467